MALPEIQMPSGLPPFQAGSHVITPEPLYLPVPRQAGHDRSRRLFTTVPRTLQTAFELTQTQIEAFNAWYEDVLQAGSLPFAANVAKIGSGTEWWKAYIVGGWKVEFQEGTQHLVTLTLRLCETPVSTGPVLTTMTSEVLVALVTGTSTDFDQALTSEVFAFLETTTDLGPVLSSEVLVHLYSTISGGPSNPSMDTEVFCHLNTLTLEIPGEQFDSEVSVALVAYMLESMALTSEVAVALDTNVQTTNYVTTPSALVLSSYMGYSPGGQSSVDFRYLNDGRIMKQQNTAGLVLHASWWTPTQPAVGTGHWIRVTYLTGDAFNGSSSAVGTWLDLGTSRVWQLLKNSAGTADLTATVEVATDPDGANIVSTMSVTLHTEYAT